MRLTIAMLALLATPARAEQWTAAAIGTAAHLHGLQAGVFGAELELAWQHDKLELYGAADIGVLQFWPLADGATGAAGRLGGGVRWLPRGVGEDVFGMVLQAGVGISGYTWDRSRLARPEVELGIGYDLRGDDRWRFRTLARFVLFEDDNYNGLACHGCVTTRTALDAGLGITLGVVW